MNEPRSPRKDPMVVLWASAHRNTLTELARQFRVTPQFCHMVLYAKRKSRDGRIERALRELGAPIKFHE